jgi:TATA-binding protein-associated factor
VPPSDPFIRLPLATLASTLFPFFRHTIANVRLAVVKTLSAFMNVPSLPRDWIAPPFLRLLFQNLIVEERSDIRDASLAAWRTTFLIMATSPGWLEATVNQQLILEWYAVVMTPFGVAIDSSSFYRPSMATEGGVTHERHNVDKNMLAQDLSLITTEVILKARIASATALAYLITFWPNEVSLSSPGYLL